MGLGTIKRELMILLLLGGITSFVFAGCSTSSAPPPPSPTASAETEKDAKTTKIDDDDELGGSAEGDDTPTGPASGSTFDFGGADIGDEDDKEAVKKCHEEGKIYDRFAEDGPKCSDLGAAQLDCNKEGILAVLTASQKKSFKEKLAGSFADYKIDQCGDCSEEAKCKSTTGDKQVGTKVLFVQETGDDIKGKALVLPVRPNGGSGSGSGSGTGSGSGSGSGSASGDDDFSLTRMAPKK